MTFQQFGMFFGSISNKLERRLTFIPKYLRRFLMKLLLIAGLPLFLSIFAIFRIWAYRESNDEPPYTTEEKQGNSALLYSNNCSDTFSLPTEYKEDGYRDGHSGFGFYMGDFLMEENEYNEQEIK